jgi:hypothetical protein
MHSPTYLLNNLKTKSKYIINPNSNSIYRDYIRQKIGFIHSQFKIIKQEDDDNKIYRFKPLILKLINSYQIYKKLNIDKYKITPIYYRQDHIHLPNSPQDLNEIPEYAFKLISIPDFELSMKNQDKKLSLFASLLEIENDQLKELDNNNNNNNNILIKSILINSILNNHNGSDELEQYFSLIDFDLDVYYIICFNYFINPYNLDKFSRLNQLYKSIEFFKTKNDLVIDEDDWDFLLRLIDSNIFIFQTGNNYENSAFFDKLIDIVNQVDKLYLDFNLVGMLRCLRNAETGYEIIGKNGKNDIIRFNIKYYRYLIINRAINEWNRNSLTTKTWNKYEFSQQWKTVWDIYYNSESLLPPGGLTVKNQIKDMMEFRE